MHEQFDFKVEKGQNKPYDIQIYALSTCGFCRSALEFLRKNKIQFRFIYVDHLDRDQRAMIKRDLMNAFDERVAFPYVILDGKEVIVGFTEDKWEEKFLKK
ncbi:MAG: glutaredoxin family protein [Asgard group archaeon]|nr:glutaredoxin family protein [Asgard group archaeon]